MIRYHGQGKKASWSVVSSMAFFLIWFDLPARAAPMPHRHLRRSALFSSHRFASLSHSLSLCCRSWARCGGCSCTSSKTHLSRFSRPNSILCSRSLNGHASARAQPKRETKKTTPGRQRVRSKKTPPTQLTRNGDNFFRKLAIT